MRIDLVQNSLEWLQWRKGGIGSSDIAAIMGVSPWGTALTVYDEKAGISDGKKQTFAMKKGHDYEDEARKKFCDSTGLEFIPKCFQHDQYEFMRASIDGYNAEKNIILEIKVPGKKDMKMAIEGRIPEYYNIQMQWQMLVANCDLSFFMCYDPSSKHACTVTLNRDQTWGTELQVEAQKFWENFLMGNTPEIKSKEKDHISDDQFLTVALAAKKIRKEMDYWETEWETVKKDILSFNRGKDFFGCGINVQKTAPRPSYDFEMMKADGVDLEKYKKPGNGCGWRISFDK